MSQVSDINDKRVAENEVDGSADEHETTADEITELASKLSLSISADTPRTQPPILICDAGYGLPREARPRKEKILAIANQLANFIKWQSTCDIKPLALVKVVGCNDEASRSALKERTIEVLGSILPNHVKFSCEPLEDHCSNGEEAVYLSPDAEESLDPAQSPPSVVVVGLIIDRRIQLNRSKDRALSLRIKAKRWPLEQCFAEIASNESLNVDCCLEGMQQWWWNCDKAEHVTRECFIQASAQAIERHAERHPSRILHSQQPLSRDE
jgi:hypothetical protein